VALISILPLAVAIAVVCVACLQVHAVGAAQIFYLDHVAVAPLLRRSDHHAVAVVARYFYISRDVSNIDRAAGGEIVCLLKVLRRGGRDEHQPTAGHEQGKTKNTFSHNLSISFYRLSIIGWHSLRAACRIQKGERANLKRVSHGFRPF
jgi:hypothetical protein